MASITTTGRNQYRATFNKRRLTIDANGKALVTWHVKTKRDSNELVTVATMRQGGLCGNYGRHSKEQNYTARH